METVAQEFVILELGIVVKVNVPPRTSLDSIRFDCSLMDGLYPRDQNGNYLVDFGDQAVSLSPGGYTLEPLTWSRSRWRWFHVEGDPDQLRVFDRNKRPEVDLQLDSKKLGRLSDGRLEWSNRMYPVRDESVELVEILIPLEAEADLTVIGPVNYTISHGSDGKPFANSLPRRKPAEGKADTLDGRPVVRYPDGGISDLQGKPAIRNKSDYESEKARTGMERD